MANSYPLSLIVAGAGGRMGREICSLISQDPDLKLAGAVERTEACAALAHLGCPVGDSLGKILEKAPKAVVIDFTSADISMKNAAIAAEKETPIVIGSTGLDNDQKMELAALATVTPILCSANMSVGINVLAHILPALAAALGPAYDIEMMEIHHRHKKDAPSGTALMLGDGLAKARGWRLEDARVSGRDGITGERRDAEIGIQALRGGDVPGIHTTWFLGPGEFIEITHHAESRENFARGALRAAKWLSDRPAGPLYSMSDVIWPANADCDREKQ